MSLKSGPLRHMVSLQKRTIAQNSNGDTVTEWVEVAQIRASIAPASVREFLSAQAQQSAVDTRIVMRYRADVNAQMRIVHRSKVYDIKGVLPDADSGLEYLTLPCVAGLVEPDEGS